MRKGMKLNIGLRLLAASALLITGQFALAAICMLMPVFTPWSASMGVIEEGDIPKIKEQLKTQLEEVLSKRGYLSKDDVEKVLEARMKTFEGLDAEKLKELIGEGDKGIRAIMLKQSEAITELEGKIKESVKELGIRGQVKSWVEANKDVIAKVKDGHKAEIPAMEIRAANEPMTPANTFDGGVTLGAGNLIRNGAEVIDLLRIQPTLWDLLPKGSTKLELYPWVNKKVVPASGAADFLAPGSPKPKVSFTFTTEKSNAKKVAVSMKVATELLDDVDGMTSFIEDELTYQLKFEINRVLMSANAATSTDPAGIVSFSNAFSTSGLSVENPNNWDCARSVIAQIRAGFVPGAVIILMNPIDTANMDMTKAISQGRYMDLGIRPVPGGFIVEDYNIPAGDIMAFALDALKTKIYKKMRISYGWENTDFTDNLVTAIAETRFHQYHSDNHAAAFVYDQLADIKSQIASV